MNKILSIAILALLLIATLAGAQTFVNPASLESKDGKLQGTVLLADADRSVPGLGGTPAGQVKHLRFFQGCPPNTACEPPDPKKGPTPFAPEGQGCPLHS